MDEEDIEFIQILNIIKRGQRLVIQAKSSGVDTTQAEEMINEAKYALRIGNRESAIEYAKKCMLLIIQNKRDMDKVALGQDGALEKLTKVELRRKATELGLDPVGLKEELIARIQDSIAKTVTVKDSEEAAREKVVQEKADKEKKDLVEREEKAAKEKKDLVEREEKADKEKKDLVEREEKAAKDKVERDADVKRIVEETRLADKAEAALKTAEKAAPQPKTFNAEVEAGKMITGLSYLIEEQRADKIYHIFNALKKADKIGFAISRTNPKLIQRTYKVDITEFMWLTDRDVGGEIRSVPPSLESIIYYIEEFIDKYPEGVILMDGLEYLIGNNTFNPVIRFLRRLVDKISTTQCILLVSLARETLDSSQVTLLEKDLYPLNYS
jgi:hypothetical protein